ncbi:hypothetical protein KBC77_03865 [Candidatus Saccharibacteria bacterium]|nr:hypothetical protein [Candidatus Saccharibacteria bacterium]
MKLMVVYRPDSEHARSVESYLGDLERRRTVDEGQIERVDIDTREGAQTAAAYGIVSYPTMIVTDDNGGFLKMWGGELPLQNELMSYLFRA